MYLDEIVQAQKHGPAKGIASICSAHPYVLIQTLKVFEHPLIEATCNQVNQYGGYTGMTPKDYVARVRDIAEEHGFPFENIILGGDHLGPNVWQNEPAKIAMQKSEVMIRDYVQAGFTKIHLDCSMKLADDPQGALDVDVVASRAARLAKVAEESGNRNLRYIVGSEVPIPGGATAHEEGVSVTKVEDVRQTIQVTQAAFLRVGLAEAWKRVIAVVVQPGVEFGDDFVLPYIPDAAKGLIEFIRQDEQLIYEAHSTDYQMRSALKNLVDGQFAILKIGPGLTFAFREAVFALAMMEKEIFPTEERSNLIEVLEAEMAQLPEHWKKYYSGAPDEQAYKRKYSMSDRIRYYWPQSAVQAALERLLRNLSPSVPLVLLSQYMPRQYERVRQGILSGAPTGLIQDKIGGVLEDYLYAIGADPVEVS